MVHKDVVQNNMVEENLLLWLVLTVQMNVVMGIVMVETYVVIGNVVDQPFVNVYLIVNKVIRRVIHKVAVLVQLVEGHVEQMNVLNNGDDENVVQD
jgi:hypothetical protein